MSSPWWHKDKKMCQCLYHCCSSVSFNCKRCMRSWHILCNWQYECWSHHCNQFAMAIKSNFWDSQRHKIYGYATARVSYGLPYLSNCCELWITNISSPATLHLHKTQMLCTSANKNIVLINCIMVLLQGMISLPWVNEHCIMIHSTNLNSNEVMMY